jgi:hypothetical protein
MHPLESTYNGSAIVKTANAGGAVVEAGRGPRLRNTYSTTAAGGVTSSKRYGRRPQGQGAEKWADADTSRSLSCFLGTSVIKR